MHASILLIEDDDNLRETLMDVLADKGYDVGGAASADEALELQAEHDFDVIVSDVRMAGSCDGIAAVERLKQKKPEIRCLIITGFADDTAPIRAMRVQVDDYLYKPFTLDEFFAAVERMIVSGEERLNLAQRLKQLLKMPLQVTRDRERQNALEKLERKIHQVWTSTFVAIRCKMLSKGAFVDFWDPLEEGKRRFDGLANSEASLGEFERLHADLDKLLVSIEKQAMQRAAGSHRPRTADQVSKARLLTLYDQVLHGAISSEEFRCSVSLARPPIPSALQTLASRLFGS